jgi:ATP-dependent helicase/nuclease subunit A
LQHALYGLAALELLKARHKEPTLRGGVYYFSSHKGRGERVCITAPALASIGAVLADLRDVMTGGHFIGTTENEDCTYCEFVAACGDGRTRKRRASWWMRRPRRSGGSRRMTESRLADERSRRMIREDLRANILVEAGAGSGKTQMLAERMAAGVARGVYQIEHMAAVTFTRKAASELRGRFHLALEARLASARTAKDADGEIRRVQSALSNLERFFAGTIHSFCARLLRERPVESGVSPGFTELDEARDLELRQRVWREFITSARTAGDADVAALLDADIKLKDLDLAFATVCDNDDVEFPPGDGECPNPAPAAKALGRFWKSFQTQMPSSIHEDTTCGMLLAAQRFAGQWRVAQKRLHRPAVVAGLLAPWDRKSSITMKWWSGDEAEKRRIRTAIVTLHKGFHAEVLEPYLTAWRQYVYRLSPSLLTDAAAPGGKELSGNN